MPVTLQSSLRLRRKLRLTPQAHPTGGCATHHTEPSGCDCWLAIPHNTARPVTVQQMHGSAVHMCGVHESLPCECTSHTLTATPRYPVYPCTWTVCALPAILTAPTVATLLTLHQPKKNCRAAPHKNAHFCARKKEPHTMRHSAQCHKDTHE